MKQPDVLANDFCETIQMIETSINTNLIEQGSLGKFIFRDMKNRWFFVHKRHNHYEIEYLNDGFWKHYKDLFPDKSQLYESKDVLFGGQTKKYDEVIERFYMSLKNIGRRVSRNQFRFFDRNEYIWNLYALPFAADSIRGLRAAVSQAVEYMPGAEAHVGQSLVTHGLFLSMNIMGRTSKTTVKTEGSIILTIQSRKNSLELQGGEEAGLLSSAGRQPRSKSQGARYKESPQKGEESKENRSSTPPRSNKKKITRRLLTKKAVEDASDPQFETLKRAAKEIVSLPKEEYIDFLRDLRDILNWHKEYFLTKMSVFCVTNFQRAETRSMKLDTTQP
jgi:hypothetical protein